MPQTASGLRTLGVILVVGVVLLIGKGWFENQSGHQTAPFQPALPHRERRVSTDPGPPERPGEISVRTLVGELVDLERLTTLPDPPFRTYLASSYDRRSKSPSDPDAWFANDDWASAERPNYVRVEQVGPRREYVLLDAFGPGALVRIWSATPTGILRIYLDGDAMPVIEEHLGDLLSGKGTVPAPFAYVVARGSTAYFPVPFRKSCKVTVDDIVATDPFEGGPLERFYYQIDYRIYPEAVASTVRPFRHSDFARMADEIERVASVLNEVGRAYLPSPQRKITRLERSGNRAHARIDAPHGAVIREMALRVASVDPVALRRATLSLTFDGQRTVSVPLGDFFGTGPGLSNYASLPFTVDTRGTLISRWPMPFRQRAELVIDDAPPLEGEVSVEARDWSDESLYFHAEWRPGGTLRSHPPRDLRLLDAEGRGTYVGTVFNLNNASGARWWGEGDEKIYVDRETFPSHFGTGTEDYFGYAWSTPERFVRPLHAQTRADGPRFDGRFSNNRFHTLDRIPFTQALRFDLELWHWDDVDVSWEAVSYYYAQPEDPSLNGNPQAERHGP